MAYGENFIIIESDGLVLTEMTQGAAENIAGWRYDPPYDLYNFDGTEEELAQVLNGYHFPVYFSKDFSAENDALLTNPVGFVALGPSAQMINFFSKALYKRSNATDIAIGLRPELCGKRMGLGTRLVGLAANFALQEFPGDGVRLFVDKKNARAIRVYEKFGFKRKGQFPARVNKRIIMFKMMEM